MLYVVITGMDHYLTKPVNNEELLTVLTEFLCKRALLMDSDQTSQDVLLKALIEAGWQVTIAETDRITSYNVCYTKLLRE